MIKCALEMDDINDQKQGVPVFQKLVQELRGGIQVSDADFDQVYPIKRAVVLLEIDKNSRVLDIGSGAGKFCIVGSLISEGTYVGVERNKYLSDTSSLTAELLGSNRSSFINDDMSNIDWSSFNCFYLYNPFCEYLDPPLLTSDFSFGGDAEFKRAVFNARRKLRQLAIGSKVLTFHGYGDKFPEGFSLVHSERCVSGFLQLRIKNK